MLLRRILNIVKSNIHLNQKNFTTSQFKLQLSRENSLQEQEPEQDELESIPTTCIIHETQDIIDDPRYQELPIEEYENKLKFKYLNLDKYGYLNLLITLKDYFMGNEHHTDTIFTGKSMVKLQQAKRIEQRTFEDLKYIRVNSGKGGNGSVSFFRDAHKPVGPPDGGDGGNGGDIYIKVVKSMNSLHTLKRSYQAGSGSPGAGRQLDGKNGKDIIIEIPMGTTIKWIPDPIIIREKLKASKFNLSNINLELKTTNLNDNEIFLQFFRDSYGLGQGWIFKERDEEYQRERKYFQDLNERVIEYDQEIINEEIMNDKFPILGIDFQEPNDQPILLVKGGKGGMGNMHFLTKDIRNPRFSKKGREGLTNFFLLELKLIADLGLVGLPNAGKSTLLRSISKARPRVGHWEFTTLQPTIGTIFTTIDKDPFTVADIPGIIKGASQNKGMGLDFLRHIERSGGLVFVVSLESKNPIDDLKILIEEVGNKRMENKKKLVIATKADLNKSSENFNNLKNFVIDDLNLIDDDNFWKIIPICAIKGENIEHCIKLMAETAIKPEIK